MRLIGYYLLGMPAASAYTYNAATLLYGESILLGFNLSSFGPKARFCCPTLPRQYQEIAGFRLKAIRFTQQA